MSPQLKKKNQEEEPRRRTKKKNQEEEPRRRTKKKNQEEEPRRRTKKGRRLDNSRPLFASLDSDQDAAPSPEPERGTPEEAKQPKKIGQEDPPAFTDDQLLSNLRNWAHATRVVWAEGGNVRIDGGDEPPRQFRKDVAARIRRLTPKLPREDQDILRARDRQLGTGIYESASEIAAAFAEFRASIRVRSPGSPPKKPSLPRSSAEPVQRR